MWDRWSCDLLTARMRAELRRPDGCGRLRRGDVEALLIHVRRREALAPLVDGVAIAPCDPPTVARLRAVVDAGAPLDRDDLARVLAWLAHARSPPRHRPGCGVLGRRREHEVSPSQCDCGLVAAHGLGEERLAALCGGPGATSGA
jgi:hypothetical protein